MKRNNRSKREDETLILLTNLRLRNIDWDITMLYCLKEPPRVVQIS